MDVIRVIFLMFGLVALSVGCNSPESQAESAEINRLTTRLDSLMEAKHKDERFDGTLVVAGPGGIRYRGAWGLADRVWNIPVTDDTRFDIASVNKSLIAGLMMIACQEGRLCPEDRLAERLEGYDIATTFDPSITLHQMLTHTSGLPDYDGVADSLAKDNFRAFKRMHFSNKGYVEFIGRLTPVGPPGEQFHYSNFAYHLLAILLEEEYGQSFGYILREKIAKPLQMDRTFSSTDNRRVFEDVAEAYTRVPETGNWRRNEFIDLTLGRRVFSTSEDLIRWSRAMQDSSLFTPASLKKMTTNHLTGDFSYGYGWVVFDGEAQYAMGNLDIDVPYLIHGGSTEGYRSMLVNINGGEWMIAFLANTGDRTEEIKLVEQIVKIINP